MANVPEDLGFSVDVLQIEQGDPVLGGVPNPATKAGLINIPLYQLASRTRYLHDRQVGIGGGAVETNNLNTLDKTGFYSVGTAATGHPSPGLDGRVIHIQRSNGEASQIATMGETYFAFRDKDQSSGLFGEWQRVWHGDYAEDQVKALVGSEYGLGDAKATANLNIVAASGFYEISSGATGSPASDLDGRVIHIHASDGEASQVAIMSGNKYYFRDKDEAAGDWSEWRTVITDASIEDATAGDSLKLGDVVAAKFVHIDKANPYLRMGTGDADNFDGLFYDDSTNTFVAKADADKEGNDPGTSRYMSYRLIATSTVDVSQESTDHALTLGDFDGGNGCKFDSNEVLSAFGGKSKSIFWQNILQDEDIYSDFYETANGPNSWLIGGNVKGDTSISVAGVSGFCLRTGRMATVSLTINLTGFSVPANDDAVISGSIDIAAIAQAAGWFQSITNGSYGIGHGQLKGSTWDSPWIAMQCTASSSSDTAFFQTPDTEHLADQSSDATDFVLKLNFVVRVED